MGVTMNNSAKFIEVLSEVSGSFSAADSLMQSVTPKEIQEMGQSKSFVACTLGGAASVQVKMGRVVSTENLTIPKDVRHYKIEAHGKVFEPPRKYLTDMIGHSYRRWVYDPSRLRYPMKRVGWEPGGKSKYDNRGKGEFVRISWDEALELVSNEIKRVRDTYGPSALCFQDTFHHTWGTIHGMGTEYSVAPRFFNLLGGFTEYVPGTCSWAGWVTGAAFMYGYWWTNGTSEGTDSLADTLQNSRMVVFWALDATKSTRMYIGHESEIWRNWVNEAGIKTVSISPELHDTAVRHSDKWIAVYPGTDAALAAALMNVWITEGTYDKEYIKTHTVGFEPLRDYILGKEDGIPKTPQWAEKICGIDAETIFNLAREWAAGPVSINCHVAAANRGWYGHEFTRMMVALQTLQGLGKPGCNLTSWGQVGGAPFDKNVRMPGYATGINPAAKKMYTNPVPQKIHTLDFAEGILNPPVKWTGGTTGACYWQDESAYEYTYPMKGYSEIKLSFRLGGGHFASYSNVNMRAKAFMSPNLETTIATTLFMEPLMKCFDIILPACTDLERNDISMPCTGGLYIPYLGNCNHQMSIYQEQCVKPLGQSMSDMMIFYSLAKKLGIYDELSEGNSEEDWIRKLFEVSSLPEFITYDEFKKKGYYVFPVPEKYEATPPLSWFYKEPTGLATPSGKIELYSRVLADRWGENHPEIGPIPKYREPQDGRNSPLAKKYPLVGFFCHPKFRIHTMMENVTWIRDLHKVHGDSGYEYEPIWISSVDAEARGIKHGDIVRVVNDKGKVLAGAYVTERIKPGTIRMFYGSFWEPEDATKPGSLDRGGSANVLTTNEPMSCHSHLHRIEHMMVEVSKEEGQN
jgi:molybdopterin guanine dinucleotide-containing S/N-oxide reductase-like protein